MELLRDKEKLSKTFQNILDTYGTSVFKDTSRLNALLMDYMPEYQNERKILMDVIKLGVAEELLSVREKSAAEISAAVRKCYALIDSTLLIKESAAEYAVTLLADAFRINIPHTDTNKPAQDQKPEPAQKPAQAQKPAPAQKPAQAQKPVPAQNPAQAQKPAPAQKPAQAKQTDNQISQTQSPISLKNESAGKCFMALTCLLIAIFAFCEWYWSQIPAESLFLRGNLGVVGTAFCSILMFGSCKEICKTGDFGYIPVYLAALLPPLNLTVLSTITSLLRRDLGLPYLYYRSLTWAVIYIIFLALIFIIIALSSSLEKKRVRLLGQSPQNPEELLRISRESICLKYLMGINIVTLFFAVGMDNLRTGLDNSLLTYVEVLVTALCFGLISSSVDGLGTGHLGYIVLHGLLTVFLGAIDIEAATHWRFPIRSEDVLWCILGLYLLVVAILSFRIYKKRKAL